MRSIFLLFLISGLFRYSLAQEGFCSVPSESKSEKPLYWKIYDSTLSPLNLQNLPGFTRSVYKRDHALISPESHVYGPLPDWINTLGAYLISPEMGSHFIMYLAKLKGTGTAVTYLILHLYKSLKLFEVTTGL
ncbi:ureidoglycine aminohydrolase [Trifolium pratense]|uniref:Ureidoglycine aminohydrolase n=1 Tax=Trifolium pratense TaxID=57577 RepID=A0A2K3L530_TRIPR|nr:ureidoglycine aminohydrolase [Trifolium pratense]